MFSEHRLCGRASIALRFPSSTVSPAHFFAADWSLQHAWLVMTTGYWVVRKQMSEAGRNKINFSVLQQQLDTVSFLPAVSLATKLCNLVRALQKIKSLRFGELWASQDDRKTTNLQQSQRGGWTKKKSCKTYGSVEINRKSETSFRILPWSGFWRS